MGRSLHYEDKEDVWVIKAVIAKIMNRRYIGFEVVREYYDFAKERLEKNLYRIKDSEGPAGAAEVMSLFDSESLRSTQRLP